MRICKNLLVGCALIGCLMFTESCKSTKEATKSSNTSKMETSNKPLVITEKTAQVANGGAPGSGQFYSYKLKFNEAIHRYAPKSIWVKQHEHSVPLEKLEDGTYRANYIRPDAQMAQQLEEQGREVPDNMKPREKTKSPAVCIGAAVVSVEDATGKTLYLQVDKFEFLETINYR